MTTTRIDRFDDNPESGRGWVAGRSRPHHWPCRHCGMVTDYHLLRDAQLRAAESLDRRDEIDSLITFKEWLRAYEWDTDPRQPDDQAVADTNQAAASDDGWAVNRDGAAGWRQAATSDVAVPQQRTCSPDRDSVQVARQAVDAIPDVDSLADDRRPSPRATVAVCSFFQNGASVFR